MGNELLIDLMLLVHNHLFLSSYFKDFILVSLFQQPDYVFLGVTVFLVILYVFCWASWTCRLMFFIKSEMFWAIIC